MGNLLKETLKIDISTNPTSIRFLPIPFDIILLLGFFSTWKSCMSVRHCDVSHATVHRVFINGITELTAVSETPPEKPA